MNLKTLFSILFFILFFSGLAQAQDITLNPSGSNDQNIINDAIKTISESGGGTVYLNSGVYDIAKNVIIRSNIKLTGDPNAILRVSASYQWFTGQIGVISAPDESLKNVEICGFQIDGNIGNLPREWDSTPGHDRDCEKLILIGGWSSQFGSNIKIHDMKLYNAFSDGIYIRFTDGVLIYNNIISNCQHEGFYLSCVTNLLIYNNQIAGITSDGGRVENSQYGEVFDNLFFSYGGESYGAYKHGENGLQIGDQGTEVNHGFSPTTKPLHTLNIEVYNNTFADPGLRAIWLDSAGSNPENNVYIHDNRFIDASGLETLGIPIGDISEMNPPTVEMSEHVFSSIFDILDTTLSDSGYVNQSSVFHPNRTLISKGTESAWIDVVGYTGYIKIGNDTYIPKPANESAVVASGTQTTRNGVIRQESSKTLTVDSDNNLTVNLEVKTTYEVPEKHKISIFGKSLNYTTYRKVSTNTTFTKTFKAPVLFPAFNPPNVSVVNFNGSHAVVSVPDLPGIVKIDYSYDNSTATEYRLIGYIWSAVNGFKSNEYKITENYIFDNSGMMSRSLSGLYIKDKKFDISKLNVTVVTPYDNFHISHFEYTVIENDYLKFFKWGFVGIIGYFLIFGRAIHKIIYSVVGKWL